MAKSEFAFPPEKCCLSEPRVNLVSFPVSLEGVGVPVLTLRLPRPGVESLPLREPGGGQVRAVRGSERRRVL